jgi:hypothetical protein
MPLAAAAQMLLWAGVWLSCMVFVAGASSALGNASACSDVSICPEKCRFPTYQDATIVWVNGSRASDAFRANMKVSPSMMLRSAESMVKCRWLLPGCSCSLCMLLIYRFVLPSQTAHALLKNLSHDIYFDDDEIPHLTLECKQDVWLGSLL